jgi:hypothetical protein
MDTSSDDPGPRRSPDLWDDPVALASALAEYDEYLESQATPAWGHDIFTSGAAHDVAVDDAGEVTADLRRLTARQYGLFAQVLRDAAECPDPWCGPDPTLDPHWTNPRDLTVSRVRAERAEMAVRAAVCDLAVRTRLSEVVIRTRAADADTLQERCPVVWAAFCAGSVDERNAITAAGYARSLPDDAPDAWTAFDERIAPSAAALPAGKFRIKARAIRERIHPEGIDERHRRAREDRSTWLGAELDGMATFSIYGPAAELHTIGARVEQCARHLHAQEGETRTLAQLRADTAIDLLGSADTDATRGAATGKPAVAITVPVLTLLGRGDEPAMLDGYGPVDTATARSLAGDATSWVRILTHPVSGTVLDLDRKTYRVPKALRRWLGVRDPVCAFPGCGRLVRDCDIDHRREWHAGGTTSARNTGPLCRPHHRVKTETLWDVRTDSETGEAHWVSPTALSADTDPPPW